MIGHSGDVQYLSDSSTKKVWKVCFFFKKVCSKPDLFI